jgi:transglycosylase-like protein with SLT domain
MTRYMAGLCVLLSASLMTSSVFANATIKYPYQGCFAAAANLHQVPLDLVLAVAATESSWDADARSGANAHGIMQIQWPGTAKHLGVKRVGELYNPCLNISLGARYLHELLTTFKGSEEKALAAYNYGPTRILQSSELPAGAKKYVATVARHRKRITQGLIPTRLAPSSQKTLVTFDSRLRAQRLADKLSQVLQGATLDVSTTNQSRSYAVVLNVGEGGLTASDQITLSQMGWSL